MRYVQTGREAQLPGRFVCYNRVNMTHRSLIIGSLLGLYYGLVAYALHSFDAGLLVTQLFLFGLPAYWLARSTRAPSQVLVSVAALGLGVGVLLEGVAQIYGLWYSIGFTELRLFGLISFEMVLSIMFQSVFLALAYEALFDDAEYTTRRAQDRLIFFGVFAVGAAVLIGLHYFLVEGWLLDYSYVWIVGTLVAAALTSLSLHKALTPRFIDKVIDFSLIAAIPLTISLVLSVTNVHKVFAYNDGYLSTVYLFGASVPAEEIVLLFAFPFLIATLYELYLDDSA